MKTTMQDGSKNPYSPPQADPAMRTGVPAATYVFACAIWLLLGACVWFGQSQLAPIYEDFDVELPRLTQLFLQPVLPAVLGILSLAVATLLYRASSSTQRQALTIASSFIGFTVITLAVYALFAPLVTLVQGLK